MNTFQTLILQRFRLDVTAFCRYNLPALLKFFAGKVVLPFKEE